MKVIYKKKEKQMAFKLTREDKSYLYGILTGILIMSQIAGIIGSLGYDFARQITITAAWSK